MNSSKPAFLIGCSVPGASVLALAAIFFMFHPALAFAEQQPISIRSAKPVVEATLNPIPTASSGTTVRLENLDQGVTLSGASVNAANSAIAI